jgi:hypothetical protein
MEMFMIELLINYTDAELQAKKKTRRESNLDDIYFPGDVVKVLPKGWSKNFAESLYPKRRIIRVRLKKKYNWLKCLLTEELRDSNMKRIRMRKHYIDINDKRFNKLQKKRVITIWNLEGAIYNKEELWKRGKLAESTEQL